MPCLTDRKFCYVRMEGAGFGNAPMIAEMRIEVRDSPNSAGVVIAAIRCARLALNRGESGALIAPSAYFMKSPPRRFTDDQARRMAFIRGHRPAKKPGHGGDRLRKRVAVAKLS